MAHPHKKSIEKMKPAQLIEIIEESKICFIQENLDEHLHASEIKLLKQIIKHEKPHHKKIRIKKYQNANKTDLFKLHEKLYLKRYKKLQSKKLIELNTNPDNGLPYEAKLTDYGLKVMSEINDLEDKWALTLNIGVDEQKLLKKLALDAFEISYAHKKKMNFIF